jgi:hypothetical protein
MMPTKSEYRMTTRWRVGWILPRLMLVVLATDVALRSVPLEMFAFRPNEALQRLHGMPEGPFEPNREYHNARSYGDLAAMGNLPHRRIYRRVDFSTDAFGFHNPKPTAGIAPAGILLGDSFAIGAEVPEEKTLSAQLAGVFSGPIYNVGGYLPFDLERIRKLAGRLEMRRGVLIYEFLEVHGQELPPTTVPQWSSWRRRLGLRVLGARGWYLVSGFISSLDHSRLRLLAEKFERAMQNDVVLPNGFANNVSQERLRNGDWMLFLSSRIEPVSSWNATAARWIDYFCWVSREVSRDGLELVVLLVPNKSTVYGPLLESPRVQTEREDVLGELERRLRERGIWVVNVFPTFQEAATEMAERHQYIYWQDDIHWNECGVTLAVGEFRAQSGLPLPSGVVSKEDPPAAEVAWKAALPPDCQSQQKYTTTSSSSRK